MPVRLTSESVYIPVQWKEKHQLPDDILVNFLQFNLFMFREKKLPFFVSFVNTCMNIMDFYTDSTRTVIVTIVNL